MKLHFKQLVWGACVIGLIMQAPPIRLLAEDPQIAVREDSFEPEEVTVIVGETLTWVNQGARSHTVNSFAGQFESSRMAPGDVFSMTFVEPGIYGYFCGYHPWMSGTVTVT